MGSRRLGAVVLLAGVGGLATEICASRLLAPYFGSSTVVWANLIGLILAYLSLGYWLGGRVADRNPSGSRLGVLLLVAAALLAVLPLVARPVLAATVQDLATVSAGAALGSFVAALLLFAVPVTLLGMVTPFALRLALRDLGSAGSVAGRLYALSTLGSIAGTFLPALVTIPLIGTQRTLIGSALLIALAALPLAPRRAALIGVLIALLLLVPPGLTKPTPGLIADAESRYQYVQVVQGSGGERRLELNEGVTTHSVWRSGTVLTGGEWDMFTVVPPLVDHPVRRVLIIGNAGGTMARAYGRLYPAATIDGVEIDGTVTELGRRYLGLGDNPRLHTYEADGRTFLATSRARYDLIIVDAYRQPYIPFQLATREFFAAARAHLQDGGVLALNLGAVPGDDRLPRAVESTIAAVFPSTWRWQALRYNALVLGFQRPVDRPALVRRAQGLPAAVTSLRPLLVSGLAPVHVTSTPMTDDLAPVEWLTDRSIIGYVAAGGRLDERLLPTAPQR
ncbi:MAG: fused MFS/spermidine synthase [Candidatus Dormibacteria bacterium]